MYSVYIIYSKSHNVYYKGMSSDINKRLQDHNLNRSIYTKIRGPGCLYSSGHSQTSPEPFSTNKCSKDRIESVLNKILSHCKPRILFKILHYQHQYQITTLSHGNFCCRTPALLAALCLYLVVTTCINPVFESYQWSGKTRLGPCRYFHFLVCLDILSLVGPDFKEEITLY